MKRSEIKQHIIETASDLFYQNGYNSTGINEIIAEAGIAKATLYNHFKSKEDICLAYLRFKNETFLADIAAYCRAKKKGRAQLIALFDFLEEFFEDSEFNGCWCVRTVAEIPKNDAKIGGAIQKQKIEFISLISTLVSKNYPNMDNGACRQLARRVYLLYESGVSESHLHKVKWPINESKALCKLILK